MILIEECYGKAIDVESPVFYITTIAGNKRKTRGKGWVIGYYRTDRSYLFCFKYPDGDKLYVQKARMCRIHEVLNPSEMEFSFDEAIAYAKDYLKSERSVETLNWFDFSGADIKTENISNLYPHTCTICGSPAYNGLMKTECSNPNCTG